MSDADAELAVSSLSPFDRLSLLIGRVAQADVRLEFTLQGLWTSLAGFGYATFLVPADLTQLVEQSTIMFKARAFDGRYQAAGLAALQSATAAHRERNRVIHDMWIPSIDPSNEVADREAFVRQRLRRRDSFGIAERKTLDEVQHVVSQLVRSNFQVSALLFSPPLFSQGSATTTPSEHDLRMIEGRFDVGRDGGARVHAD